MTLEPDTDTPRGERPPGGAMSGVPVIGIAALRQALLHDFRGRIAVSSSFGADSALLLAIVAEIDRAVPVLFLQTGKHFPETLAYRATLAAHLGLTDVRDIAPDPAALEREDPVGLLSDFDPDSCCAVRKVAPLDRALAPFAAWVTGRRQDQASTRAALAVVEHEHGRVKINPLAGWTAAQVAAEFRRRGLPAHPLVARGYRSIGCAPCTAPVGLDDDARSGRWAGRGKVECGIHRPSVVSSDHNSAAVAVETESLTSAMRERSQ